MSKKTVPEIIDTLMYGSYKANRGYGLTHEQLLSIGIGNEDMKQKYESKPLPPALQKKYNALWEGTGND